MIVLIYNIKLILISEFKRKHLKFDDIDLYIQHSKMIRTSDKFQITLMQSCNNTVNIILSQL